MKRISEGEKRQLGVIIHFYRNQRYRSDLSNKDDYKQVNFSKGICSQAQLSRLENGGVLKQQEVYEQLLSKLNLPFEKTKAKDVLLFDKIFQEIYVHHNTDYSVINTQLYQNYIESYQELFKDNILFTHYTYALEWIILVLKEDYEEAQHLREVVEETLDLLPISYLILTLQYLGHYYRCKKQYDLAHKYYLLAIEHMAKEGVSNPIIYMDIAYNCLYLNRDLIAYKYLGRALSAFKNHELKRAEIYRYYSIIYLKAGYYDESLANLLKAKVALNHYPHPVPQRLSELIVLESIIHYLSGDQVNAQEMFDRAKAYALTDRILWLEIILNRERPLENGFKESIYDHINAFYRSLDRDKFFEDGIESLLNDLPIEVSLVIVLDHYRYLKEGKKYKKAIELAERYHLFE